MVQPRHPRDTDGHFFASAVFPFRKGFQGVDYPTSLTLRIILQSRPTYTHTPRVRRILLFF